MTMKVLHFKICNMQLKQNVEGNFYSKVYLNMKRIENKEVNCK